MPRPPTIRSLAKLLRLSVATVSEALRESARVAPATRKRVRRAAEKAGYQTNPLLGAALSAVRRSRHQHYRGTLALVDTAEGGRAELMLFHREVAAGARARALELGFNTELFWLGAEAPALPQTRLPRVLHARGITGAVLLPFNVTQDLGAFDFARLAAVQMDYSLTRPHLHSILPDHFLSMVHTLERLEARGYRRIGLCLEQRKEARLKNKWTAGYLAHFRDSAEGLPPLVVPQELTREVFLEWFHRHRPEVVVGHVQEIVAWLQGAGVRVPQDTGFFNLNLTERTGPCAGLDLQPQRLGAIAVETVVAMLHRQERGVPAQAQSVTLEGLWNEGPTLRRG
jgi:LacI family transcriptional regulator